MTHRREQSFIYLKEKLKKHIAEEEEKNRPRTAEELLEAKAKELSNEAKEKEQKIFGDGETAFGKGLNVNEVTPELLFDFEKLDKKKLKIPYYLQGNPVYYNQESLQAREKLKSSVRIRQVIQLFWDNHPKLPNGEVSKEEFIHLLMRMRRCVFPDFDKTKSKLSCLDDWDSMKNNEVSVDKDEYFESLFEVADMWVDSLKEEDYIDFLHKMYSRVTMQAIASLPYSEKYGKAWMKRVEQKKKSRKPKELTPEEKHENTLKRIKKYKEEVDKDTPLICYVTKKKDLEALIVLVEEEKEDINQMNLLGQTPFMFASKCGKMKLIDYIYKKGGNINDQDVYFNTALHYCALKKHRKAMTYLLKHGALRLANKKGTKPAIPRDLRILYGGNNLDEENENIGRLNKKKKKVKLAKPEPQELSTACKMSNVEKVRDLLERGADPNERDISGSTPLIHCAWRGHVVISQMLYEKGADIDAQNLRKNTALHFAYERNNKALITFLESHGALRLPNALGQFPGGKRPTDVMSEDDNNKQSQGKRRSSMTGTVDVNDPFIRANMRYIEMGLRPLSIATIQNDIETVKLLFKQKVNVNEVDKSGATALHYAAWYNRYTILRMLIAEGAEVNATTNNGNTPMHFACERKNNDCIRYLEIKGAVLMKNDLGQYPGQRYEVDDHILLGEKKTSNKKPELDLDELIKPNIQSTCETISWDSVIQKPSDNNNDNINEKQSNSTILHVEIPKNDKDGFSSSDDSDSDSDSSWSSDSDYDPIKYVPTAPKIYDVTLTHLHDETIFLETKMTRLQYACSIGDLFEVKNLILEGDIIDYRSELGHTALMCASVNGHIEIVRFLVNSGCNQRLVNNSGYTALMLALYYEQYQVANYLGGSRRLEDMISYEEMRRIRLDAGEIIDKRKEKDIEKRKRKSTFASIQEIQSRFDEDMNVLENSKDVRSSITPISQRFSPHPPLTAASTKAINENRRSSIRNRRIRPQSAF